MLQSFHNVRVYQSIVANCLSDHDGLCLTKEKYANRIEIIAKRSAAILKRSMALQDKMNELIRRSRELLQK